MAKYRIVEKEGKFYPEVKTSFFGFWERFESCVSDSSLCTITVYKKSLQEAKDFISYQIIVDKIKKVEKKNIKIHKFAN